MIEKIRSVQNPLTVIAIFAALAEIAGTVALATVDKPIQHTFVWFVMAFPTCLVLLFFATLNFNAKVLYAPSDFKDEENFLNTLAGGRVISESFQGLTSQLEIAKQEILAETVKRLGVAADTERQNLANIVNQQIELLREKVERTRESAIETTLATAQSREVFRCTYCRLVQFRTSESRCRRCHEPFDEEGTMPPLLGELQPRSLLQAKILDYLRLQAKPASVAEIASGVASSEAATQRALEKLSTRGLTLLMNEKDGIRKFLHYTVATPLY